MKGDGEYVWSTIVMIIVALIIVAVLFYSLGLGGVEGAGPS